MEIDFLTNFTQMSNLPGKRRSGIRVAYKAAPTTYRIAQAINQPNAPKLKALKDPKVDK